MQQGGAVSVLVIDDDELVRETLRTALEGAGYRVVMAPEGEEGVALFHTAPTDVVLCDIFMPGMEGIETIRMLRRWNPEVKIVAISGGGKRGELAYLDIAQKLGADRALAKPFAVSEMLATIRELVPAGNPARRSGRGAGSAGSS